MAFVSSEELWNYVIHLQPQLIRPSSIFIILQMTQKPNSIIVKYQKLTQGYLSNSQTDYVLYEKLKGTQCPTPVKFRVGAKVKPQGTPGTSTAQPYNKKR